MKSNRSGPIGVHINYWAVFSDISLNSVIVLIFFLFCQFLASSKGFTRVMVESRQRQIGREVKEALGSDQRYVSVVTDGNLQRLRFSDAILFDSGKDELKSTGEKVLKVVGDVLRKRVEWVSGIQIEGHTDSRRIRTMRFPSNWELSSARATRVVRFFQDNVGFDPAKHPLSATGRAEYVPVVPSQISASGSTSEKEVEKDDPEAINRRVEIILVYSEKLRDQKK